MNHLTALRSARLCGTFAFLMMLFLMPGKPLLGSDDPTTKATLRGINGISVVVENLRPGETEDGLTVDKIQTDVELSLRKAGVKVIDSALIYLYVSVNVVKADDLYAYNCLVSLEQPVTVHSNAASAIAPTWSVEEIGMVPRTNMSRTIRAAFQDLVEKFLNAYLSANPR